MLYHTIHKSSLYVSVSTTVPLLAYGPYCPNCRDVSSNLKNTDKIESVGSQRIAQGRRCDRRLGDESDEFEQASDDYPIPHLMKGK